MTDFTFGPKRNFHKVMSSPYFQSGHYRDENPGGRFESKIEKIIRKIFKRKNANKT